MNRFYTLRTLLLLLAIILFLGIAPQPPANAGGGGPFNLVFAPTTPDNYVEEVYQELQNNLGPFFNLDNHWNPASTATGDGGASQGDSLTLTWSIIPDGTFMPAQFSQDTSCNSTLIADMNATYGPGNWENEIANIFADWASKTGNEYVRELNDDGAAWPNSPGSLGVRGDIRIGGCTIDGNSQILAYNFFPSNGDMKLDSKDSFFGSAAGQLTTGFHNVVSHEHGHGAGLLHVCPVNETKLMEPFLTTSFKGLQHDDIRAAQRNYGDPNERIGASNDSAAAATPLGTPLNNVAVTVQQVSIDDDQDEDWYQINVSGGSKIDLSVTPVGFTYPDWDQVSGVCETSGPTVNSATIHNLNVEILDSNGTTVLTTGNSSPAGSAETLADASLGGAGTKYIRIFGSGTDNIQLYDLQFTVKTGLSITKTAAPNPVVTGQPLTYTITLTNTSSDTHTNLVITDAVPANTTYIPGSASDGGSQSGGIITWPTVASLGPNTALSRTFVVTVAAGLANGSTLTNTAHVSASNIADPQLSNPAATTVLAPVLELTITPTPFPILATTTLITYNLTLNNSGDAAATDVVITNTLPASTTYVAGSASDGGSQTAPGVIVWPATSIPAGAQIDRSFRVNVTQPITDGDQLVNVVSASSAQGAHIENMALAQTVGLKLVHLPILLKK